MRRLRKIVVAALVFALLQLSGAFAQQRPPRPNRRYQQRAADQGRRVAVGRGQRLDQQGIVEQTVDALAGLPTGLGADGGMSQPLTPPIMKKVTIRP